MFYFSKDRKIKKKIIIHPCLFIILYTFITVLESELMTGAMCADADNSKEHNPL